MFNEGGEIALFRKCGMQPVFFGETLVGTKVPNLTYMVAFENEEAKKANWKKFLGSPGWKTMSKLPIYQNTVSHITNIVLRPTAYSQI
ncbi:NIPSNAP family protein [bacterium]|nr:NIPSNAP family protein [bacterium]